MNFFQLLPKRKLTRFNLIKSKIFKLFAFDQLLQIVSNDMAWQHCLAKGKSNFVENLHYFLSPRDADGHDD